MVVPRAFVFFAAASLLVLATVSLRQIAAAPLNAGEYELTLVQVLTRHGARTPFDDLPPGSTDTIWDCHLSMLSHPDVGQPIFDGRLYRKRYIPNREVLPGNCSQGQLTSAGVKEHLSLGKSLRERYVNSKFLSSEFNASEIYVRSTDSERTIMSAQSGLLGLYPIEKRGQDQIIDINVVESLMDNMIPNGHCPKLVELCNDAQNTSEWLDKQNSMIPIKLQLMKTWNVTSLPSWLDIFDNIYSRDFHGLPLPQGIDKQLAAQITEHAAWELDYIMRDTQRTRLGIGSFIQELLNQMLASINGQTVPRYSLYSGHDITLTLLLHAFGVSDGSWPGYASFIQFELYKNSSGNRFVQMFYEGKMLHFPGCEGQDYCPFEVFQKLAVVQIPSNWRGECALAHPVAPISDTTRFFC